MVFPLNRCATLSMCLDPNQLRRQDEKISVRPKKKHTRASDSLLWETMRTLGTTNTQIRALSAKQNIILGILFWKTFVGL